MFSDKTKSRWTTDFNKATVDCYDKLIGLCHEAYNESGEMYSIYHVDDLQNNDRFFFRITFGMNTRNLISVFKSIECNHFMLKRLEEYKEMYNL